MPAADPARGVVTIQSHVAYGHVGNSAAVFALQRLGHEAWPVNVLAFSNHPGHGTHAGRVHGLGLVREIVDGLERLGVLAASSAVLTGYLPSAELVHEAARAVDRARALGARGPYLCDPVIGDRETGRYVADGVADAVAAALVPRADLILPNVFELETLTGAVVDGIDDAMAAARALASRGPRRVVVTGLAAGERVEALLVEASGAWSVTMPALALEGRPDGAGDLLAAVMLARILDGAPVIEALAHAMAAVHEVLACTVRRGTRELALVEAQARLASPRRAAAVARLD